MDFVTLMTCCAVAEACLAGALVNPGRAENRAGWNMWALSLGMRSSAFLLYLAPVFVSTWVLTAPTQFAAVMLIMFSAAISMKGTAEFLKISPPRWTDLMPVVAMIAAYTLAFVVFDSPRWRIALVSAGLAYGLGWSIWRILQKTIGSARERWFVVVAMGLWILILLARAFNVLTLPATTTATAVSVASTQPWFFIGYLIAVVTTVVGLIGLRSSEIMGDLEDARSEAERRMNTDTLTGLMSRSAVLGEAERMFKRREQSEKSMAVLMLDCDHFKSINDRFGHLTGDLALKEVGRAMRDALPDGAMAGRFGGEEFLVLLPSQWVPVCLDIAHALRSAVKGIHLESGRRKVVLSVSIGAAIVSPDDLTVQEVLHRADTSLLHAKDKGRDRVVSSFSPLPHEPV